MFDRHSRQSFLGVDSERRFREVTVGIVGLGGGGSHFAQQLAHLGILNFDLFDGDRIEASNLNRLVGGRLEDIANAMLKVDIAKRTILSINPEASIVCHAMRWQKAALALQACDVVFSGIDGFQERSELEAECRRYLIPLIDIGMDVTTVRDEAPVMAGQVILSMPGHRCMRCFNFITEQNLNREVARYGQAGINPQVIWANGALASTGIGLFVDLLTNWSKSLNDSKYLQYSANSFEIKEHPALQYLTETKCLHYPLLEAGPTRLKRL